VIPVHTDADHEKAPWLNTEWRFEGHRVMRCSCAALVVWPDGMKDPYVLTEEERRSLPGAWIPPISAVDLLRGPHFPDAPMQTGGLDWEVVSVEVVEETDRKYVFNGDEADDIWRDRES
jgi:hypothetical protein